MAGARAEKVRHPTSPDRLPGDSKRNPPPTKRRARIEQLIHQHADFAARTLRIFGLSAADADDGLQEVFIVLARRLDDIRPDAEKTFVFRVAQHIALRMRESRSRKREDVVEEPPARATTATPEVILDNREALQLMSTIVGGLPEPLREVLVLFELEEVSTVEIAQMLNIPRGTVVSRLKRARELVEERMQRRGYGGGAT